MTFDRTPTRRRVLTAGAGGAGALVLAACSSTSSGPTAARSSSGAPAGPVALVALADVAVGTAVPVDLPGGRPGIVTRTSQNEVVCFSAICTHQGCTVAPAGATLDCPCHGSQFDARTGKNLSGPAPAPLTRVAVHLSGANVVTDSVG